MLFGVFHQKFLRISDSITDSIMRINFFITITFLCLIVSLPSTIVEAAYDYQVVAKKGDQTIGSGILTGILSTVSINDHGKVVFIGNTSKGNSLFVTDGTTLPQNISFATPSANRVYALGAQINNSNKVIARDRDSSSSYIRVWDAGSPFTLSRGDSSQSTFQYDAVYSHPTINNKGSSAFSALNRHTSQVADRYRYGLYCYSECLVSVPDMYDFGNSLALTTAPLSSVQDEIVVPVRPLISDDGRIVYRAGNLQTDPIRLIGNSLSPVGVAATYEDIATSDNGDFSELGRSPGISDDGQIIVFYGTLTTTGAAIYNHGLHPYIEPYPDETRISLPSLVKGEGIFASIEIENCSALPCTPTRILVPVATLDEFDSFSKDMRVAVNSTQSKYTVTVVFRAIKNGVDGIYVNQIRFGDYEGKSFDPRKPSVISTNTAKLVLEVGAVIDGFNNGDPINDIQLYDPINNSADGGTIAMWVQTQGSNQAVILARQKSHVVVLLTHGFKPNGDWNSFRAGWHKLADKIKDLPKGSPPYEGNIATYVSEWDSSESFTAAFASLFLHFYFEGLALASNDLIQKAFANYYSINTFFVAKTFAKKSARKAEEAALQIFKDLTQNYLLSGPCLPNSSCDPEKIEKIFVVGHSRGGAVNARVTNMLVKAGYNVAQVVVLDGFSTDFSRGGSIGDISITTETLIQDRFGLSGGRKINYLVDIDLGNQIVDQYLTPITIGDVSWPNMMTYEACKWKNQYCTVLSNLINSLTPPKVITHLRSLDLRAPFRAGFDNIAFYAGNSPAVKDDCNQGIYSTNKSYHVNITSCYRLSEEHQLPSQPNFYIFDNFIKLGN